MTNLRANKIIRGNDSFHSNDDSRNEKVIFISCSSVEMICSVITLIDLQKNLREYKEFKNGENFKPNPKPYPKPL